MTTVLDLIRRFLPQGSNPWFGPKSPADIWNTFPPWPPDLFAVTANLVEVSSCYASASFDRDPSAPFGRDFATRTARLGQAWNASGVPDLRVQRLWGNLLKGGHRPIAIHSDPLGRLLPWAASALELMAIADEASASIGFSAGSETESKIARYYSLGYWRRLLRKQGQLGSPAKARSLCWFVPEEEACVQPKATTPQLGCTLRSLSHNLALLPSKSVVATKWLMQPHGGASQGRSSSLNLLLVPFPYFVGAHALVPGRRVQDEGWASFKMDPKTWLPPGNFRRSTNALYSFMVDLVEQSLSEVDRVHGIVLPELALPRRSAEVLGRKLQARFGLDFFVSGVSTPARGNRLGRNEALFHSKYFPAFGQSKHHRWRLNRRQIDDYHLPMRLDRNLLWWEDIDISQREVTFYQFGDGACMAVLVCEDLARVDPVQPVLRAVGPNLVVALLMDGPQVEERWSARYATVLADDPGSAVLTLTSMGMVRRYPPKWVKEDSLPVALWKDVSGAARSLKMPGSAHALLLRLSVSDAEQRTLDRRSDGQTARLIVMGDSDPVPLAHPRPPRWLEKREPVR